MYGCNRQKDFFWGAMVGGAVAAMTTLLFTTKKGKQIQKQIVDMYHDLEEDVKEKASDVKDKFDETVDQFQHKKGSHKKDDHK